MMNSNEQSRTGTNGGVRDLVSCSLSVFAAAVINAVRSIGTGKTERYGARKVFISAAYRALVSAGYDVGSLDGFKARMVSAQCASYLLLARADLVGAMPTATVAASEISDRGATFHFVLDSEARDPWDMPVASCTHTAGVCDHLVCLRRELAS
jgi:hypothetical protein